jgi:hypothetical protein
MAARYQSLSVPAIELSFAIAAFACGLFDAPMWLSGLVCYGMLLHWSWSRRRILNRLRGAAWASQTALAICVLIAILVGAYWLGMQTRGL